MTYEEWSVHYISKSTILKEKVFLIISIFNRSILPQNIYNSHLITIVIYHLSPSNFQVLRHTPPPTTVDQCHKPTGRLGHPPHAQPSHHQLPTSFPPNPPYPPPQPPNKINPFPFRILHRPLSWRGRQLSTHPTWHQCSRLGRGRPMPRHHPHPRGCFREGGSNTQRMAEFL